MNFFEKIIHFRTYRGWVKDVNINHEHKFIFIHIPKTAGTSVAKSLGFQKPTAHITAEKIKVVLNAEKFQSYFKFCFVRNPWDRFLSLYNYARQTDSYYHSATQPNKAIYGKHTDYDLLKNASIEDCTDYLLAGQLKHDRFWNHWQNQSNWIYDKDDTCLVDYIGHFENLEQDLQFIFKKIKLPIPPIKNLNASRKKEHYQEVLSDYAKNRIAQYYQKDIQQLKYTY